MKAVLRWGMATGLCLMGFAHAGQVPIYPISGSVASYVDQDGYVQPIFDLVALNFGGGLTLPLNLNFSSGLRSPSPEFGQGWECPLFDAKVFDYGKGVKEVHTLGGKTLYLDFDKRQGKWHHVYSDNWAGVSHGSNGFELIYRSGYHFKFVNGLLESMTTPEGREIDWIRHDGVLAAIGEKGKAPALQLERDSNGYVKKLDYGPDGLGHAKAACNFNFDPVTAGIDRLQMQGGKELRLERSRDSKLNPILQIKDGDRVLQTVSWSIKTGKILSDDEWTYNIVERSLGKNQFDTQWPTMERVNKKSGFKEVYNYDPRRGIEQRTMADGTVRTVYWIVSEGANYKKVREIRDTKNGKSMLVVRRAYDEQGHTLLESMGLAKGGETTKQYVYDTQGRMTVFVFNGKTMWRNVFDSEGKLVERELPAEGVKFLFASLPKGEVQETILSQNGQKTVKTLAPTEWQALTQTLN